MRADSCRGVTAPEDLPVGLEVEEDEAVTDDPDLGQAYANVCLCPSFQQQPKV